MTKAHSEEPVPRPASIADPFWDLLAVLDDGRRLGLVRRLAVGYYEGWRPSRAEVAMLVDFELGRISAAEFLATPKAPVPQQLPTESTGGSVAAQNALRAAPVTGPVNGQSANSPGASRGRPARLAAFSVDCGELAPPFRFVAKGLSSNGWTVRGGRSYRLMSLHYALVRPANPAGWHSHHAGSLTPVLFTAAIICVPDVAAPWAETDGRSRKHAVGAAGIVGSRGPWPISEEVQRISFLISGQPPMAIRPAPNPAGTLRVDIKRGSATWRRTTEPSRSLRGRAAGL